MAIGTQGVQNFAQSFGNAMANSKQMDNQRAQQDSDNAIRDQKMAMLQAQNADIVERQQITDFNSAVLELDLYKNPKAIEQLMKSDPQRYGGEYLAGVNEYDITRGGMTVPPEVRQQFKNDTGYALPSDDREAAEMLRGSATLNMKDGGFRYVDKRALGLGLSNYNTYKEKYIRDRGDIGGGITASSFKTSADNKGGFAGLSNEMQNQAIESYTDAKVLKTYMRQDLAKPSTQAITSKASKDTWNPEEISDSDLQTMFTMQSGAEYEYKGRQDRLNEISAVNSFSRVNKMIDDLPTEERTQADAVLAKWAARSSEKDWAKMDKKQQHEVLERIRVQSSAGKAAMDMLKLMSGAAVTEDEFQRYQDVLFAGGIDKANIASLRTSLGSVTESLYESAKGQIQGLGFRHGYDKLDLAKKLEQSYSGITDVATIVDQGKYAEDGQGVSKSKVAEKTLAKEGSAIVNTGINIVKEGYAEITGADKPKEDEKPSMWESANNTFDKWLYGDPEGDKRQIANYSLVGKKANAQPEDVAGVLETGEFNSETINTPQGVNAVTQQKDARIISEKAKFTNKVSLMSKEELATHMTPDGFAKLSPEQKTTIGFEAMRRGN